MNSYCQSPAYNILYKTLMTRTIIHLGKLCCTLWFEESAITYQELFSSAFIHTVLLSVVHTSVFQASLQWDAHMCICFFIELYAMPESLCTHHFKRSLQPSQRDYWPTQRNKICSPCFERQEPACNYKLSVLLASFLMAHSIISVAATMWVQKRQLIFKKTCRYPLDIQKPFCVHVHIKEFCFIHLSLHYPIALNLKNMELIFFIGVVLGEFFSPKC